MNALRSATVEREPFPHVVIDHALDDALYRELVAAMPSDEELLRGRELESNMTYRTSAEWLLREAPSPWRAFAAQYTSREFFAEVVALFNDELLRFADAKTSIRYVEPFADVALDCQLMWGSPVKRLSRPHPVHVDRECALFAGLLYFRRDDDDSRGGDLELYRWRGDARAYDEGRIVPDALVQKVKTIPYAANRLVLFPHSPDALHGVSLRSLTPHPRLHVNFLGELQTKVFDLDAVLAGAAA
jgi:hypothetical protein